MTIPEDLSKFSNENLKFMIEQHGLEVNYPKNLNSTEYNDNVDIVYQIERQALEKTLHNYILLKQDGSHYYDFGDLPKSDELIQALNENEDLKMKIKYLKRQHVKKWNASKVTFKVQHKGSNPPNIEETLLEMLKDTIKKKKLHKNDRIRLIIWHNNLHLPLSTKLIKVNELDVSKVASIGNTIEYKEFPLNEAEITIETIKLPRGAGRTKPGLTLNEHFIRQKRSTVK